MIVTDPWLRTNPKTPEAYRKNYRRYVEAWATALASACDAPEGDALQRLARAIHVLTYGAVFQALQAEGGEDGGHLLLDLDPKAVL